VDRENSEELTHVSFLSCAFVEITPQCSIGVDETFVSAGIGEIKRRISAFPASRALVQPLA
jgi:hypothetical protein